MVRNVGRIIPDNFLFPAIFLILCPEMNSFVEILSRWYALEGRDLPWRATRDPYLIWLSEVILQQTRVEQGTAYYMRFAERFPRVEFLAEASEDEVLKLWQGLGYYSRARNLHAAAQQIVGEWGGQFPRTLEEVRRLKGVGEYTAAAICSAAFDLPCAAVDGNVYRVLSRLYDVEEAIDSAAGKRTFRVLAEEMMRGARPSIHNQAMMDFGAMICTSRSPRCGECPLQDHCMARAAGTIEQRPVKNGRQKVRKRWFNYLDLISEGRSVLVRRGAGDIWQGLYEFPLVERDKPLSLEELANCEEFKEWVGMDWTLKGKTALKPHRLSHQLLHAEVWRLEVMRFTPKAEASALDVAEIGQRAVPRLLELYLNKKG